MSRNIDNIERINMCPANTSRKLWCISSRKFLPAPSWQLLSMAHSQLQQRLFLTVCTSTMTKNTLSSGQNIWIFHNCCWFEFFSFPPTFSEDWVHPLLGDWNDCKWGLCNILDTLSIIWYLAIGYSFWVGSFFVWLSVISRLKWLGAMHLMYWLLVGALIKPDIAGTQTESVRVNQFHRWTPKHQMMKRVWILKIWNGNKN